MSEFQQQDSDHVDSHSMNANENNTNTNNDQQQDILNTNIPLPNPPDNPDNQVPSKTLWMGDIEPYWNEDYIVSIWSGLNKIVMVKVIKPKQKVIMPNGLMSNSLFNHSGYCFVEFQSFEDAKDALSLNGSMIPNSNNKSFRLNWASAATLATQITQTPEYSLFVGDLSPETSEAHLLSFFQSHFQSVKTVRVMTDPASGISRCFGFVRFTNEDDRSKALIELNGKWLNGRPIRVALATPKHQNSIYNKNAQSIVAAAAAAGIGMGGVMGHIDPMMEQQNAAYLAAVTGGPPPPLPGSMGFYGSPIGSNPVSSGGDSISSNNDSNNNNNNNNNSSHNQNIHHNQSNNQLHNNNNNNNINNQNMSSQATAQAFNDPNNTTVFVGGLASGVTEDALLTLFEPFGNIVHVKVPPGKGCGFVKFQRREDAEQSIAGMQGFIIGGARVRLSWGRSSNRYNQHNLNQQMLMAANPLSRQVVGNAPSNFDFTNQGNDLNLASAADFAAAAAAASNAAAVMHHSGLNPGAIYYDPYAAAAVAQQQQAQQQAQVQLLNSMDPNSPELQQYRQGIIDPAAQQQYMYFQNNGGLPPSSSNEHDQRQQQQQQQQQQQSDFIQ